VTSAGGFIFIQHVGYSANDISSICNRHFTFATKTHLLNEDKCQMMAQKNSPLKKGRGHIRGTTLVIARQTPSNHFIDITTRLKPAYLYSISLVPVAAREMNSKLHWYGAGSQSPACAPCCPFTIFTTSRSKHFSIHVYILHVIIQYYTNSNQEPCAYYHENDGSIGNF